MRSTKKFRERLKHLMVQKQVTAKTLGRAIGCNKSAVYAWLSGRTGYPSFENTLKLAAYFHRSLDFLLGGKDG